MKIDLIYLVFFDVLLIAYHVASLTFNLQPNAKKCLKEEIRKGEMVKGEYSMSDAPGQKTDLLVTDTKGHILVNRENTDKGTILINTNEYDVFEVCFETRLPQGHKGMPREVTLILKRGVEAKNYEALAEVGKLKPLEVELERLEDLSHAIVKDFAYMRTREEEMRDTNESTNSRVFYLSIFSMCCLLGLATWQVLYLRRFFKAKKLIE